MTAFTASHEAFTTERLTARRIVPEDADGLFPTLTNPDLLRAFGWSKLPDPRNTVAQAAAGWGDFPQGFTFTLAEHGANRIVGFAAARPNLFVKVAELEIAFAPEFYGRGYGFEAMYGLIDWSFAAVRYPNGAPLDEVRAGCMPSNAASLALCRKLAAAGMKDLGEEDVPTKASSQDPGAVFDLGNALRPTVLVRVFSIARNDFQEIPGRTVDLGSPSGPTDASSNTDSGEGAR